MKIGFFDSGIGGTTVMEAVKRELPEEEYIYFGDTENCPYGEKSLEELQKIVTHDVEYLLGRGAEVIVVACNTATTRTIKWLREKFPEVPFVGTEPAIKKACEETEVKEGEIAKIVLISTPGTAKAKRTEELIAENIREGLEIEVLSLPGLARAIEENDGLAQDKILLEYLGKPDMEAETVVLGCTHYPLIKEKIQEYFPKARMIDGGEGVAKEVRRVVEEKRSREEKL